VRNVKDAGRVMQDDFILVVGAAHIDILAKASSPLTCGMMDRPGKVSIEVGGTAANIAVNLRSLGARTKLLTALPEYSAYASLVKLYLHDSGVELVVHSEPDMSHAAFSAHIDHSGEVTSAITESPLDYIALPDDLVCSAMTGARVCIADCNLSVADLRRIAIAAAAINAPLFVAGVSEAKSGRLLALNGLPVTAIIINQKELVALSVHVGHTEPMKIAKYFSAVLIVTKEKNGLSIFTPNEGCLNIPVAEQIADEIDGNFLGGGDAIIAGVAAYCARGYSIFEAAQKAMQLSASVISRSNCSLGQNGAIEQAIRSMDDRGYRDPMTGLLNRRGGEKKLIDADSTAEKSPYHLLMIDIDHFKRVNDTYGHDIGDAVIKCVSHIIAASLRAGDSAIRWGGEEFICVLSRCDQSVAVAVAERIRSTIERAEIEVVGKVSVSTGVASWQPGMSSESVMKRSDEALYHSKQTGRNRVSVLP
jgi:diguanylate cyclase (GGDEF)-like protein